MAFGNGQVSTEGNSIKRYIGVASVSVLSINPNKAELEKLYNRTIEEEPKYAGEVDVDGVKIPQVRLDFIVKADPEKYLNSENKPLDFTNKVTIFLRKSNMYNKDKTKVKVVDKYGNTAWVTIDEAKNHLVPMYSNGPAGIDPDYKPIYQGEEELINFLINYLNIPAPRKYVDNKWVWKDPKELSDSEARLDYIDNYFKGDVSELKTILSYQPNNKIKVLFGIRNTDDGKQYQSAYTRMFLKNSTRDYSKLEKHVNDVKSQGALSTTEFEFTEIHEYSVKSTDFNTVNVPDDLPFNNDSSTPW